MKHRNFCNTIKLLPTIWFVTAWFLFIAINFHQHTEKKYYQNYKSQTIENHCYSCDFIFSSHHLFTDEINFQPDLAFFDTFYVSQSFCNDFPLVTNHKTFFASRAPPYFI